MRGKEDPYQKIGQSNDRTKKSESDYVWALRDINLEVKKGEVLGIIGRNGAGKSTLLKILSQVTSPTTGRVEVFGRIASLLEVGTGFHPELTGRENIFLNGAILGMRRHEIQKKFDEIVDFAGVEAYIDTPVKRYSSGMYVRLAFAVAAFLEPEILVVDEVLAVGDAEFQKKCLGRMKDVSVNEGRTVLFVSHNLHAIEAICSSVSVIESGHQILLGPSSEGIKKYREDTLGLRVRKALRTGQSSEVEIISFGFQSNRGILTESKLIQIGEPLAFTLVLQSHKPVSALSVAINLKKDGIDLISHLTEEDGGLLINLEEGAKVTVNITTDSIYFAPGMYSADIWIGRNHLEELQKIEDALQFEVVEGGRVTRKRPLPGKIKMFLGSVWSVESVNS